MRINRWRLALIVGVFVIFAIYLLPTPKSLYGTLYGYLDVWIQQRIQQPEVIEESSNALSFDLSGVKFPEGIDFQEATSRLEIILRGRLEPLGYEEVDKELLSDENPIVGNQFSFDTTEEKEFLVKFAKSKDEIEAIAKKLNLYGAIPPSLRNLFPDKRINLGLDLRGGVHLVLELDMEETKESLMEERTTSIYDRLKSEDVYLKPEDIVREPGRDILLVDVTVQKSQFYHKRNTYDISTKLFHQFRSRGNSAPGCYQVI